MHGNRDDSSPIASVRGQSDDGSTFKVFRSGDERRAFRLENIFWDLLDQAAKSEGKSLRDLVLSITDVPVTNNNRTSLLRAAAASWAVLKVSESQSSFADETRLAPFYASPTPGIIIAEDRRIVAYNKAMLDYIGDKNELQSHELSNIRFAFEIPIGQIVKILQESPRKFIECGFRLTIGEGVSRGRARIWPSNSSVPNHRQVGAFIL